MTGEASLAHTGAIVDDQTSLNIVTHFVFLLLKEWGWDQMECSEGSVPIELDKVLPIRDCRS